METLRDLPDLERLEEAVLLSSALVEEEFAEAGSDGDDQG